MARSRSKGFTELKEQSMSKRRFFHEKWESLFRFLKKVTGFILVENNPALLPNSKVKFSIK